MTDDNEISENDPAGELRRIRLQNSSSSLSLIHI